MDNSQISTSLMTWCLEQLETIISEYPDVNANWIVLALLYNQLKRPDLAVDVCQRAIEVGIRESLIYFNYADALFTLSDSGLRVERLLLNDIAKEVSEEAVSRERLLSLERGISSAKAPMTRLAQYVIEAVKHTNMSEAEQVFERLVKFDVLGHEVETVIQQLSYLENVEWMIESLKRGVGEGRFTPSLNLARVLLLNGEKEECRKNVENMLTIAKEPHQRAEAQMLLLEIEVPAIQADLADILGRLQRKGGEVYESDLEFLEYLVENAPDYAEGYLALAAAYRRLDEPNTALEVLLDAEKITKGTPEIYLALSELFEQEEELALAIENIRKGLDLAPMSVPLMAHAALLAYLSGDDHGAQVFLRRAHAISPYHPRLVSVTRRIQDESDDEDGE
jgi:tetratricopeptide (TPR) repeat protein